MKCQHCGQEFSPPNENAVYLEGLCGECYDDFYEKAEGDSSCPICGGYQAWEDCWQCHGEGGFHDCGEDTCCCLDKEEVAVDCDECHGAGGYLECGSLPHSEEQLAEYRKGQQDGKAP